MALNLIAMIGAVMIVLLLPEEGAPTAGRAEEIPRRRKQVLMRYRRSRPSGAVR